MQPLMLRHPDSPLSGVRVLIFDWDGTLFDSMPTKYRTFSEEVTRYLNAKMGIVISEAEVLNIYQCLSGRPRREIFQEVAKSVGATLNSDQMDELSAQLTARNEIALKEVCLFQDAIALLEALTQTDYRLYISSSVPTEELQLLVDNAVSPRYRKHFQTVLGSKPSFGKGPDHINWICEQEGCGKGHCHMFGDDEADMALSLAAGIDSTLVNRGNQQTSRWRAVHSLESVIPWL